MKNPTNVCLLFLVSILLLNCSESEETQEVKYKLPPEWEPHEAVWIDFPDERGWGGGSFPPDYPARIEIIGQLIKYVPVNVILDNDWSRSVLDSMLTASNVDRTNIKIVQNHLVQGASVRDYGPILLTNGTDYLMADFGFDGYGEAMFADSLFLKRAKVDNIIADSLGYTVNTIDLNSEGGGFVHSSKVLIMFEEFATMRNPDLSLKEIEKRYLEGLRLEKIIWIKEPMLLDKNWHKIGHTYGQGGNYHMDAYLRFVNDSTILIPMVDPSIKDKSDLLKEEYEASIKNLEQLRKETNYDGKPFNIIEIPYPDLTLYQKKYQLPKGYEQRFYRSEVGDTITYVPVMGYSNFLITNGAVLVSEYWHEGLPESERVNDERMKEILRTHFPNRDIIGIKNTLMLNWFGGGIHCQTMQIPKIN